MEITQGGSPILEYDALPHEAIPRINHAPDGGFVISIPVDEAQVLQIRLSELQLLRLEREIRSALLI